MKRVTVLDTTLRDGEQTPGVRLGASQKVDIARQLVRLGVDVIEAGFPAAGEGDFHAVEAVSKAVRGAQVQALARASHHDIELAAEALKDAENPRIHVFLASSDLHLKYKLKMSRKEALERVKDSVSYAKSLCARVQFSPEDATRSDRDYLCEMIKTAIEAGADVINVPDTVGYTVPGEFSSLIEYIRTNVPGADKVVLSVHCHNDLGLAVANSLCAVEAGALQIECTVNGLGERAGNASLEELVMALRVRGDALCADTGIHTEQIVKTSRMVASMAAVPVSHNKAVVGDNAFSHESGIHQHGVMEKRETYEIMRPEDVGFDKTTMVLGKLSGRHAYKDRVVQLGYSLDDGGVDATFARFKEIADKKNSVTDEDIRAIVNEYLDGLSGTYRIDTFQIQSGNHMKSMALISLRSEDTVYTEAAPGDGPVDAAFNAVNRIADAGDDVRLDAYEIRAVTDGADALGEAKVKISSHHGTFTGRGVSTDIIKASLKAYVNAVNKWVAAKS